MDNIERQVFLFGQMYNKLLIVATDKWKEQSVIQALEKRPFSMFTKMYAESVLNITKEIEEYIRVRMNDIDIDFIENEPIPLSKQPMFMYATHYSSRDIKNLIDTIGLSQQDLANELGVNRMTVNRWYNANKCSEETRYKLEQLSLKPKNKGDDNND